MLGLYARCSFGLGKVDLCVLRIGVREDNRWQTNLLERRGLRVEARQGTVVRPRSRCKTKRAAGNIDVRVSYPQRSIIVRFG